MSLLRLRSVLSVLLALTLALPAYTCDGYRAPDGQMVNTIPEGVDSTAYVAAEIPHRPLEKFEVASITTWLTLFAYLWPLLLLAAVMRRPTLGAHWLVALLSLMLPVASGWWIYSAVVLGDIAYGAVLSLSVLGALLIIGVGDRLARRSPVVTTLCLLILVACGPAPQIEDGDLATPLVSSAQCSPLAPMLTDTIVISLPAPVGGELSIESPDGVFFQLVSENPAPDLGPQLMTAAALKAAREVRLPVGTLSGLPFVYGATDPQFVFREPGEYRIRIAERLETDDGTPVASCVVRFGGRSNG